MKTPYCGAVRVQRREVDQLKVSIGEQVGRLSEIDGRSEDYREAVRQERTFAAGDWQISSAAYFARVRQELEELQAQRTVVDAHLDELREKAREAFGSLWAVENAAEDFRTEAERVALLADQASLDDRMAAEITRIARLRRAGQGTRAE